MYRKFGLQDESLSKAFIGLKPISNESQLNKKQRIENISSITFEFGIKEIMSFNNEGEIKMHIRISKNEFLLPSEIQFIGKLISKLPYIHITDNINKDIHFIQIRMNYSKVQLLSINNTNLTLVGIFSKDTKNSIIRLFLMHLLISYYNFLNEKFNIKSNEEFLKTRIYEKFLFFPLQFHFLNITLILFRKNELFLPNFKYKDFILVDLNDDSIMFNLKRLLKSKKTQKIQENSLLWNELLFHSHNLKNEYDKKFNNVLDPIDYQDYFVRVEYTSTYPRLIFIVKFLPILKGVALIHVYTHSKLSRNDNEGNRLPYKEFEILYACDINKDSSNIGYRYREPKLLKEIESFFIEFYLSSYNEQKYNLGFYTFNGNKKYFSNEIIALIRETINTNSNISDANIIVGKITNSLYDDFLLMKDKENLRKIETAPETKDQNKSFSDIYDINNDIYLQFNDENNNYNNNNDSTFFKNEMISSCQWNYLSKNTELGLFQITKKFTLTILFMHKSIFPDLNFEEATINLTKFEDNNTIIKNTNKKLIPRKNEDKKKGGITYQKTKQNGAKIDNNNNNASLFDLDITEIHTKEMAQCDIKEKRKSKTGEHIQSKSVILVNKITEKLKNNNFCDYGYLNTGTLNSFTGEDVAKLNANNSNSDIQDGEQEGDGESLEEIFNHIELNVSEKHDS